MALKINNPSNVGLVQLSALNVSDVFQYDGGPYILVDRHSEKDYFLALNIIGRYTTKLSKWERVLPLDATLEIHGPQKQSLTEAEVAECSSGRKIHAIKLYRDRTGVGLLEAKNVIEREMSRRGIACC